MSLAPLADQTISLRNIARRTLVDVSFVCPHTRITSLIGPSGCGKSTLLRLIAGLEEPEEGSVLLGGEPPCRRRIKGEIGLAFQDPTLLPWRTVRQNIELPLKVLGRFDNASVEEVISMTALEGLTERLPSQLSGGQAQRVSLARALVTKPSFLLLDEPFTGLDFLLRRRLNTELVGWIARLKITAVVVTHDPREAILLANHLIVLGGSPTTRVLMDQQIPETNHNPETWKRTVEDLHCNIEQILDRNCPS